MSREEQIKELTADVELGTKIAIDRGKVYSEATELARVAKQAFEIAVKQLKTADQDLLDFLHGKELEMEACGDVSGD